MLALAACKDAAGPAPDLQVRLAASTEQPVYGVDEDGASTILCTIHFDATGEGSSTEKAQWSRFVLRYFTGPDRTAPLDSLAILGVRVAQSFGDARIGTGESQRSSWQVQGWLPFSVEGEAYYLFGGTQRSVSARASCGAEPSEAAAAPVLSNVALTVPDGPLQPWDSVTVTWTATAGAGLWETGVTVAGSDVGVRFREEQRGSVARTVRFPVPNIVGVPLTLQVYAVDALGRVATSDELMTPPVVDVTPPVVLLVQTQPNLLGVTPIWLRGHFGLGDTIQIRFIAQDNHRLTHLVYGAGSARDSIALPGSYAGFLGLPIQPAWEGHSDFWLYVRDASGLTSEPLRSDEMRFYPVRSTSVEKAELAAEASAALIDEARGQVWLMGAHRPELRAYSLPGLQPRRVVALPSLPGAVDLSGGGDTLVVALAAALATVDLRQDGEPHVVPLVGVRGIWGMQVSAGGEAVVLAYMDDESTALLAYDLSSGRQRVVHRDLSVPGLGAGVARSGDRRRMLLGGGCRYDPLTHTLGTCAALAGAGRLSGDRVGARWASSGHVFDENLQPVLSLPWVDHVNGAWMTPGGEEVVFNTVRGPLRVRVADGRYLERVGRTPVAEAITGSSDGRSLILLAQFPVDLVIHVPVP